MEKLDHKTKPLHIYLLSLIKNHSTSLVRKNRHVCVTHPKPSKPSNPNPTHFQAEPETAEMDIKLFGRFRGTSTKKDTWTV